MPITEFAKTNLTISSKGKSLGLPFCIAKELVLGKKYELSLAFVSPKEARALNIEYRKKDHIPNTLSFPYSKKDGEIIICLSEAKKQHKKFSLSYEHYILFLFIHSMLHLKGYEHGSTMDTKEQYFLKKTLEHTT
jgi:probable rRNA maturation factor